MLVTGAGPIGLIAAQTARAYGADAVTVTAAGASQLDGSRVDFKGDVQLSEALTQQTAGGGSLLRVAQQDGRLTLPATVTGSASAPRVRIDVQSLAGRALKKTATEQGEKLLRGLGGLLRR